MSDVQLKNPQSGRGDVAAAAARPDQAVTEHREVIDLVYYHEQSVDEAAQVLSIPAATVKTRMFYARKKLGEWLKAAA
jgi:RNA polymerase sigma-70 factor (ECF subfamily)